MIIANPAERRKGHILTKVFTLDALPPAPPDVGTVLDPSDIAGNDGMFTGSYNLQGDFIWREADYNGWEK